MVPDALSPVAPARVRCLLVPAGRITRPRFLEFVRRLQNESVVRLGDISPNSQPGRESFSPLAFPSGIVLFDLSIADPSPGQRALYPFELFREPLVIIGLADASEYVASSATRFEGHVENDELQASNGDLRLDLAQALEGLRAIHNVALVHQIFLFDALPSMSLGLNTVVPIPSSTNGPGTILKTKMCDLTSSLLSEMGPYSKTIHGLSTIETPRQLMPEGYVRPAVESEPDSKRQSWFPGSAIRATSPNLGLSRLGTRASLPAHLFGGSSGASSPSEEQLSSEASSPSVDNTATTFDQMHIQSPERRQTGLDGTPQGATGDAATEKGRSQGRGRVSIVLGEMYMLAGRWPDAIKEFIQGALAARATNDHIWHAKAVDMILVILLLCAWNGIEFEIPPICLPIAERSSVLLGKSSKKTENMANEAFIHQITSQEIQTENIKTFANVLPEIIQHIIRLYTRTTAESVAHLVLADTFIRLSKLSTILLHFPDLGERHVLDTVVLNRHLKLPTESEAILSLQTPARAEISSLVLATIPSPGLQEMISHVDRLAIYAGVAAVMGMLGYQRKKVFILRELLTFLLPALEAGDFDAQPDFAMLSESSRSTDQPNGHGSQQASESQPGSTMYDFLLQICRVYGAVILPASDDLESKRLSRFASDEGDKSDESSKDEAASLAARIENDAMTRRFGSQRLKLDVLFACISVCEIIPDLRGAVSFSSSLLRTVGSGIAPGPQTVDGGPALGHENQAKITDAMRHAAATAVDLGVGKVEAEYWDDFLVREIEVLPTSPDLAVAKRKRSELAAVKQSLAKKSEGPFIVNKFNSRASVSAREHIVVAGEKFCFAVLLQNLYDVPLDIDSLEIDVHGAKVESRMESFSIGAYQTQRLRMVAQANSSGPISIHGCLAQVRNCSLRRYPIFKDTWRPKDQFRIKQQGLALIDGPKDRPTSTASDMAKMLSNNKPAATVVQAKVIEPQPRMVIKKTSLVQSNITVLEGERKRFTISVQNVSKKPVDFVALTFDDSTLPILQAAVQDRELPAADLYEVEFGIYRKSAVTWPDANNAIKLDAGEESQFEVEVLGKPGLSFGTVHFDYAALGTGRDENDEDIYIRRTSITFAITVNPSVDLIRNDILSLTGPLAQARPDLTSPRGASEASDAILSKAQWTDRILEPVRQGLMLHEKTNEQCLLLLDFYNSWTSTLLIMPQIRRDTSTVDDKWQDALQLSESVDPGQSTRFLVPVPRMSLKDPYAPIPSLNPASKRQFVVSAGKVSESYERSSRDAFWHREELLKHIRVAWLDPATTRTGLVEMRAIRLTVRMLDALKLEGLTVDVRLSSSEAVTQTGPDRFRVSADEFVTIKSTLTNRSEQPIYPLLRLQPSLRNQPYNVALDMSKKFAFTGLLQQPLPLLEAGASSQIQLGAIFLCAGEFEISASVEEMRVWRPPGRAGNDRGRAGSLVDLDVLSTERTDRRIWFAREPCKIDVNDQEGR